MSDKRSVHTDALETLGTIIDNTAAKDAIHLAVYPIEAGTVLYPGQDIGVVNGKAEGVGTGSNVKPLGIVDPFLKGKVMPGERFWLIVYPRTITSLRHVWEHPDFAERVVPTEVEQEIKFHKLNIREQSEAWLKDFCSNADCPGYYAVIDAIERGDIQEGYGEEKYLYFGGQDAHGSIPDIFWDHVEIVTGKKFKDRATHFSCSC